MIRRPLLLLMLLAIAAPASAQTGAGPNWEWLVGVLMMALGAGVAWGFRIVWVRIDEAHQAVSRVRDILRDDHLTERETREIIGTAIRLAIAEQMPQALAPLRSDISSLSRQLVAAGVYRASGVRHDDGN
jgi:hypothetical protein